jgi:hypothetical protein
MEKTKWQSLLERYEGNRVIRGLIQLVPLGFGSAADVALVHTLEQIREKRTREFFDELARGNIVLDESLLESEDFLHCYFSTAKYALNSRRREKIQMFARLLKSSITDEGPQGVDEYEDFLKILDELSFRELQALNILDTFSGREKKKDQDAFAWTGSFWGEFIYRIEIELNIRSDEVTDFINKISRTGCYEMFVGGYFGYKGGRGQLTATYHRLKKFIMESSKEIRT